MAVTSRVPSPRTNSLAVMAYGLTFLFGITGSLAYQKIGPGLFSADRVWIAVIVALVVVGFGFEITMVPFHFWAPDVFAGVSAPVAGFISVVPKIAAFAGLVRLTIYVVPSNFVLWPYLIAGLAVLSMVWGNVAALKQQSLKRLLAYSSIAQGGYILTAVAVCGRNQNAWIAIAYYLAAYLFMNLGAFAVVGQLERTYGTDQIHSLHGFGYRAPAAAVTLALSFLSLAGIPPLAGFGGKVHLLGSVIDGGMAWLAVAAAANMVVALFYYVNVIAQMYLHKPGSDLPWPSRTPYQLCYLFTTAGTLVLGIIPGPALAMFALVRNLLV